MIQVLTVDAYSGFLAFMGEGAKAGAQPIFIGRIVWPGDGQPSDAVIKLYKIDTCGIANEAIGFAANRARGVMQPEKGAVLLLTREAMPDLGLDIEDYIDKETGVCACWATSFEQGAEPFKFIRRLSTFSQKQSDAFYKSKFCKLLAGVDYVTGNSDRHEGNFLYKDDLKYLAIDQGCVGGGLTWHKMWPDPNPRNEISILAQENLGSSHLAEWQTGAILEYEIAQQGWSKILDDIAKSLPGLLDADGISSIIDYMTGRATGSEFAVSCGRLI